MVPSNEVITYLKSYLKTYLRIDYTEDDSFIADIIRTGFDYLANAIDHFAELYSGNEEFARKADVWVITQWCPPMYDQREGMFTDSDAGLNYAARAMLTQLQMYKYEETEEEETNENET